MRVAIYARVSTDGQTCENQLQELRRIAESSNWTITDEYVESISGAKSRKDRPQFDALCKAVTQRKVDMIAAWSVDRLGRSLQDLVGFLSEIQSCNVGLYLHQQGIDTTTPAGKAMFQMLGVFAEFERAMIRERVCAGLERAKSQGKTLGRPPVSPDIEDQIKSMLADNMGKKRIAKTLGVGVGTVQRVSASSEL